MFLEGSQTSGDSGVLGIIPGFISKWTQAYERLGRRLAWVMRFVFWYLSREQRQSVSSGSNQGCLGLVELQSLEGMVHTMVLPSKQSFKLLGQQTSVIGRRHKRNPKQDPVLVETGDLTAKVQMRRSQRKLVWCWIDATYLWGDICGYGLGQDSRAAGCP